MSKKLLPELSDEVYADLMWWDDEVTLINHDVDTTNHGITRWTPHDNTPVDLRKTVGISAKVYDD